MINFFSIKSLLETALENKLPRLEADILLAQVLSVDRTYLYTWPEKKVKELEAKKFHALCERRLKHEPIAYLTGIKEFYGLTFQVTPDVLIPRPETETLIEEAIGRLDNHSNLKILELGTGSGAIAITLGSILKEAKIIATDLSKEACQLAKNNSDQLGIKNVDFVVGDWFLALENIQNPFKDSKKDWDNTFDMIISNPPYIALDDPHLKNNDLLYEPKSALVSGSDGLKDLREIILQSSHYLKQGGFLILEHGYNQFEAVQNLMKNSGFCQIFTQKDLAGVNRLTLGYKNNA